MAKKKKNAVPKRIAGIRVPKAIRKSRMLRAMLASPIGRDLLANALTAGAGAAAAVLIRDREEVAEAGKAGARKGARALGLVKEAGKSAAQAVTGVVSDAAQSVLPTGRKKDSKRDRKAKAKDREGQSRPELVRH